MNPVTYTGNGTTQSITGVNFQPDFVWVKSRNFAEDHQLTDSVRGATKVIQSNLTDAESTMTGGLTSFDTDGFSVGNQSDFNYNGDALISWNWKAGGSPSSNTDGSITSSVSVNTTAGFSIISWGGTDANGTVGHGLGVAPKMVLFKTRGVVEGWATYHASVGATGSLPLNTTAAFTVSAYYYQNTNPSSTVITVGAGTANKNTPMIAYAFTDVKGFSKMGSYIGNGNADGTFVYTGFKPSFIIWKNSSASTQWVLLDNKRLGYNPSNYSLFPNNTDRDADGSAISADLLSNGFKLRTTSEHDNQSGSTFIYMAFAENPLVANTSGGIPTTAR